MGNAAVLAEALLDDGVAALLTEQHGLLVDGAADLDRYVQVDDTGH